METVCVWQRKILIIVWNWIEIKPRIFFLDIWKIPEYNNQENGKGEGLNFLIVDS